MAKKFNFLPFGIGLAALGLFIFKKGKAAETLQFKFTALKFIDFTLLYSKVRISFEILNPSPFPIVINSLSGVLFVDGVEIGNFNKLDQTTIKGKAVFSGNAEVSLQNLAAIGKFLKPLAQGKEINLELRGTLFLPAGPIDFSQGKKVSL